MVKLPKFLRRSAFLGHLGLFVFYVLIFRDVSLKNPVSFMKRLSAYLQPAVYLFTFSAEIRRKQVNSGWSVCFFGNDPSVRYLQNLLLLFSSSDRKYQKMHVCSIVI